MMLTEPGYYWVYDFNVNQFIIVKVDENCQTVLVPGIEQDFNVRDFSGWFGPLFPPGSPDDEACWYSKGTVYFKDKALDIGR